MSRRRNTDGPSLHSLLSQASRRVTSDLRRVVGAEGLPVEFWRVLEVMADAALIQRSADPADQRRVILHISDFGLQKFLALGEEVRQHRNRLENTFGPEREEQLRALLRDFIKAHRQSPE